MIIGPSGVGKSVILKKLRTAHPELHFPRSATTRARRQGEGDELYHFVSESEFDDLMKNKKLLEWALVHGIGRYGTMIDEILPMIEQGRTVIREVEVQGFDLIRHDKRFFGPDASYQLESIFILPESTDQIIQHIQKRAPMSKDELYRRLESMKKELTYADQCTHTILNKEGKLADTISQVEAFVLGK